jgi:hypothetical protein
LTIVNALQRHLKDTVDPAFLDFQHNPKSWRHAYQACVAAYHAVDRVTYPKKPGNLRSKWRKKSFEFMVVDMVAHKYKHVVSDDEKEPVEEGRLRLSTLIFGGDLHNLYFIIRDAIKFLHQEALKLPDATLDED